MPPQAITSVDADELMVLLNSGDIKPEQLEDPPETSTPQSISPQASLELLASESARKASDARQEHAVIMARNEQKVKRTALLQEQRELTRQQNQVDRAENAGVIPVTVAEGFGNFGGALMKPLKTVAPRVTPNEVAHAFNIRTDFSRNVAAPFINAFSTVANESTSPMMIVGSLAGIGPGKAAVAGVMKTAGALTALTVPSRVKETAIAAGRGDVPQAIENAVIGGLEVAGIGAAFKTGSILKRQAREASSETPGLSVQGKEDFKRMEEEVFDELDTILKEKVDEKTTFEEIAQMIEVTMGPDARVHIPGAWNKMLRAKRPRYDLDNTTELIVNVAKNAPDARAKQIAKPTPKSFVGRANIVEPAVNKIARLGAAGKHLAVAFIEHARMKARLRGPLETKPFLVIKKAKLSKDEKETLEFFLWEQQNKDQGNRSILWEDLSDAQKNVATELRSYFHGTQAAQNSPELNIEVDNRRARSDPNYFPGIVSREVLLEITNSPEAPFALARKEDWITHTMEQAQRRVNATRGAKESVGPGVTAPQPGPGTSDPLLTREGATSAYEEFITGISKTTRQIMEENPNNPQAQQQAFAAIRQEQGLGIPWSWTDKDLSSVVTRYGRRVGSDMAFDLAFRSNPVARTVYGLQKPGANNPKNVPGTDIPIQRSFAANPMVNKLYAQEIADLDFASPGTAEAIATEAGVLLKSGLLTIAKSGIRDLLSNQANMAPHIRMSDVENFHKATKNLSFNAVRAYELGLGKESMLALTDPTRGLPGIALRMRQAAEFQQKWAGRTLYENGIRTHTLGMADLVSMDFRAQMFRAPNGEIRGPKEALRFMDDFGDTVNWQPYIGPEAQAMPPRLQDEMSARFVESMQGTFDLRQVPTGVLDTRSFIRGFTTFMSYPIGRGNEWNNKVLEPLLRGNATPFFKSTLAAPLAGAATLAYNEMLSGLRSSGATFEEAMDQDELDDAMFRLAYLATVSGAMGIQADYALAGYKTFLSDQNQVRGALPFFPLADLGAQMVKTTADAQKALRDGVSPFNVALQTAEQYARGWNQYANVIFAATARPAERSRVNRNRDIVAFQSLNNEPPDPRFNFSPYFDPNIRKYKRSEDPAEIGKLLPPLLSRIVRDYAEDPIALQARLQSLNSESVTYLPDSTVDELLSLKNMEFISWKARTDSPKHAAQLLVNQYSGNLVNGVKNEIVAGFSDLVGNDLDLFDPQFIPKGKAPRDAAQQVFEQPTTPPPPLFR